MYYIFTVFVLLITSIGFADQKQNTAEIEAFKGIKSFTVLSKISPWSLEKALKSELVSQLNRAGQVVSMDSEKAFSENLGAAMKDATFFTVSTDNFIEDVSDGKDALKVVIRLSLVVYSGYQELAIKEIPPKIIWEKQVFFDFNPKSKILITKGSQELTTLVKQFLQDYALNNPSNRPVFYVL